MLALLNSLITIVFLLGLIPLILARLLQQAMKMVIKVTPNYRSAYISTFFAYTVTIGIDAVIDFLSGRFGNSLLFDIWHVYALDLFDSLLLCILHVGKPTFLVVYFLVQLVTNTLLLKYPDSGAIGFNKGFLVSLVQAGFTFIFVIVVINLMTFLLFVGGLICVMLGYCQGWS
jgi:hypothetical protein